MNKQLHNIETIASLQENVVAIWSADIMPPHSITPDLLVPDGYIEVLFIISGGFKRRKLSSAHDRFIVNRSVIIGIQDTVFMSQPIGHLKCIGILFDPMQFYLLFGDIGAQLRNKHRPVSKSGHNGLTQLEENIHEAASVTEALQEIESFFADYAPQYTACDNWRMTQDYLQDLRIKKENGIHTDTSKLDTIDQKTLNAIVVQFTGFTLEELSTIISTAVTYEEPDRDESTSFPSLKKLWNDIDESQEDQQP
ncbi:hypothetical protein FGM00_03905 [Aggregatimonas sangjinii]|uniref:AraC family transcriptional regulator n=1 Tax=Aggregatimonas sangjinii TaxID=2583587 RepID=A0A5B7SQM0_9FLAO|nr:DUF6597 domain-containing transcriptional factor [Aggregatimonas sangjinii]QCW99297.1 hypothetical protein FGM00_03905 [Aggregatimonas sangjinii]